MKITFKQILIGDNKSFKKLMKSRENVSKIWLKYSILVLSCIFLAISVISIHLGYFAEVLQQYTRVLGVIIFMWSAWVMHIGDCIAGMKTLHFKDEYF